MDKWATEAELRRELTREERRVTFLQQQLREMRRERDALRRRVEELETSE
jgi:hypothetical protein